MKPYFLKRKTDIINLSSAKLVQTASKVNKIRENEN